MVEPEVAYASYEDMMDLGEGLILFIADRVLNDRRDELNTLERDISNLEAIASPFPRLHYDDAVKMLQEGHAKGELGKQFRMGRRFWCSGRNVSFEPHGKPVFVHHFPAAIKGFYFEVDKDRPECALGIDLLAPEGYGEIIGGGERATSLEYLEEQLKQHDLPQEIFEWYLDLRRYGSVPHAGFGMGIERCTAWMAGIEHVRETIPFPRMLYRLRP